MIHRIICTLFSVVLILSCSKEEQTTSRPNVLIFLADDQGWGDLSIHGNPYLHTPHIDSIAHRGASFDRFYVQPVCSPTRAELLTGRYHVRAGVSSTSAGGERIDLDEELIAQLFLKEGYETACFGKWHSGSQHPYHPNSRGFDSYYGFTSGHWGHYFSPTLDKNGTMVQGQGYLPDDLTNHTIDFIRESQDPFFVLLALNTPHSPMQVPERWWTKFEDLPIAEAPNDSTSQNHARAALAMVENIDWNVGRINSFLKEQNLLHNTIVLYLTDNGPNGVRYNGEMKGRKGSTDEGGVRSPLFVQWPDKIKPGLVINHISAVTDLAPTLAALCNVTLPPSTNYDGINLAPLLFQDPVPWPERNLIQYWRGRTSVRTQQFRLDHEDRLYDMVNDPGQHKDISAERSGVAAHLKKIKTEWQEEVLIELPEKESRPFTIGHPDHHTDYLPARDGHSYGSIVRSNRYPNDSYFTNWTSTADSIIWAIDVLSPGTYEIDVHYTCPMAQLGSKIHLRVDDQDLSYTIKVAHNPQAIGAAEDRVRRIESYTKDFKQATIGSLVLKKGTQQLLLTASEIPNQWVMEINRLTLRRISDTD